ncbi:TPA: terminase small subunit [Bacillus cereus]
MAKLTPKQKAFADYYIELGNATEAAKRAGYSKKTARFIGKENLSKPYIREYIDKIMAEKEKNMIASQDEILKYLTRVMRREEMESVVVTIRRSRSWYDEKGKKHTEETESPEVMEIPSKLSDANKAAELLGKRYLLWTEKKQITGDVGVVIIDDTGTDDEEE